MKTKRCSACGKIFHPRPQVPRQSYCQASECQRKRKQRWQRETRRRDPDYRDNQSRAQQEWLKRNPSYWRRYREAHPEYLANNRAKQRQRNRTRPSSPIAKMDVLPPSYQAMSGIYRLNALDTNGIAKMDAWIVEINVLSEICNSHAPHCKERT